MVCSMGFENNFSSARTAPIGNRSIVALLWSFAFLSYLLRINISVAQQYMARELSLSECRLDTSSAHF